MINKESEIPDEFFSVELRKSIDFLERLSEDPEKFAQLSEQDRIALTRAAGRLSRPSRDEAKRRTKASQRLARHLARLDDRALRATTGLREARKAKVFSAPKQIAQAHSDSDPSGEPLRELKSPRNCYVCKAKFTNLHFFYDEMCLSCADYNYKKRFQTADLTGQVAVITGARLKIGYHATVMMLKAGARVIATTRFPVDAAMRFSREPDFNTWKSRLQIYGLDLRHTPSVEIFARYLERTETRLDILINNAAQTVRRPPAFYQHLLDSEALPFSDLPNEVAELLSSFESCKIALRQGDATGQNVSRDMSSDLDSKSGCESGRELRREFNCDSKNSVQQVDNKSLPVSWHAQTSPGLGLRASAQLSQIPYSYDHSLPADEVFPAGQLDQDLQQVDLRETNSWRLKIGEVPTPEMLEVQLVNAVAPFVLCSRLSTLMRRDFTGQKHIVNVTAMEGKFYRFTKADRHPHTNMAKAALNMLTHTSASDLAKDGIFMNAVDTGWVTDEDPAHMSKAKQDTHDFQPPLDIVDGAARICDPFFSGILTGEHWRGKFLKDYFPISW